MAATLILISQTDRNTAANWVAKAPRATVVTFKKPGRTTPQNKRMWAMLTDVSMQIELNGRKHSPEQWKVIFMSGLGVQQDFIQGLEGEFIPAGFSTSKMNKDQMNAMMAYIEAEGTQRGVKFRDGSHD